MRFGPAMADAGFHDQRHRDPRRALHHLLGDAGGRVGLGLRRLEQQLVMHLQQQPRRAARPPASACGSRTMARLMMSAAPPCSGALIACRSA